MRRCSEVRHDDMHIKLSLRPGAGVRVAVLNRMVEGVEPHGVFLITQELASLIFPC